MRRNLLEFLFGSEALHENNHTLGEEVVKLFEEAADEETEQMVANKKPLAAALKDIGIYNDVIECSQCCEIQCADAAEYRNHVALLHDPDSMHRLAEEGWVVACNGDVAMSNEPADYKIGFIELSMGDMPDNTQDKESLETVLKNAQKFSAAPVDRENDELNPVETDDNTSKDRQKGVGKPKAGNNPKGKIKDSVSALRLANRLLDDGPATLTRMHEMTGCSAIPAVESPMGIPARNRTRKKFKKTR